jgi:hypothetical protein
VEILNLGNGSEDSSAQASPKSKKLKVAKAAIGIGTIASFAGLGSTLAANITLNDDQNVEFGQGVAQTAACDADGFTITPISYYDPDSSTFRLDYVEVSGLNLIPEGADASTASYDASAYGAVTLTLNTLMQQPSLPTQVNTTMQTHFQPSTQMVIFGLIRVTTLFLISRHIQMIPTTQQILLMDMQSHMNQMEAQFLTQFHLRFFGALMLMVMVEWLTTLIKVTPTQLHLHLTLLMTRRITIQIMGLLGHIYLLWIINVQILMMVCLESQATQQTLLSGFLHTEATTARQLAIRVITIKIQLQGRFQR